MGIDSLIGQLFDGRYLVERRIGSGGMADVYLARDESLGRNVAIKVLADRYARDDAYAERFRREASAAAGLSHPNIVGVYDRGQADGSSYIAMEYLNGPTLKDEIARRAPLPEADAVNWAVQALDALEYAHRQGVVHRDIKPHNMVLTDEGRLKVTDFGIARAANTQQMTEVGSIVGTAQYLSPEQARGLDVGPQSDLYSMGIVLYEMLTGELPFTGDSAVEIAMKQVSDPPPPIHDRNRLVSPELEQIVMRALAKDPAVRHRSARQMADELRSVTRGGPLSADTRQATRVIAGAALAAGAADAGSATAASTRVLPGVAGTPPPPATPRRSALPWLLVLLLLVVSAAVGLIVYDQLSGSGITVPTSLKDRTCAQAKQQLPKGLTGKCVRVRSSLAEQNLVVRTDPALGSSADSGSVVTLFIGNGPSSVKMPDLRGKKVGDATLELQTDGFTSQPTIVSVPSTAYPNGYVVGSSPKPGAGVKRDAPITLRVSDGTVAVPDVSGLNCQDAMTKLSQHKLKPTCQSTPDQTVPKDQVIKTDPPAGQVVVWGTPVTVEVSAGPSQSSVPNVVGLNKNDAITALHDAGFKVAIVQQVDCTDPAANDTVQSQNPSGGAQATSGSTVEITVLKYRPSDPSCVNPPAT